MALAAVTMESGANSDVAGDGGGDTSFCFGVGGSGSGGAGEGARGMGVTAAAGRAAGPPLEAEVTAVGATGAMLAEEWTLGEAVSTGIRGEAATWPTGGVTSALSRGGA